MQNHEQERGDWQQYAQRVALEHVRAETVGSDIYQVDGFVVGEYRTGKERYNCASDTNGEHVKLTPPTLKPPVPSGRPSDVDNGGTKLSFFNDGQLHKSVPPVHEEHCRQRVDFRRRVRTDERALKIRIVLH